MMSEFPVITIDGPSGSGKGTIAQRISTRLGWHYLDSGAIYRVLALNARRHQADLSNGAELADLARRLAVVFIEDPQNHDLQVLLEGEDVTQAIRDQSCSQDASTISSLTAVREALLERQRAFCKAPGLVTDGRDMGTVVFPDAEIKIFLDASLEERAQRRYLQLKKQGFDVSLASVVKGLAERDERDINRSISPLLPAADAVHVDTTGLTIEEVIQAVLDQVRKRLPNIAQ